MSIKNSVFLRALRSESVPCTPVWLMRQAGRYLPEYRAVRKKAKNFLGLCQNPDYAAEVTLQPITRFGLDAAIVFSDILVVPDAMGCVLHFVEGEGPTFKNPIKSVSDVQRLQTDNLSQLQYVWDTVAAVKALLPPDTPLIGFAGSPWTLACYMIEGMGGSDFIKARRFLQQDPAALHVMLNKIAEQTAAYLIKQVDYGADCLMIFDTWGGLLAHEAFSEFSLEYMQSITRAIHQKYPEVPVILYTKQGYPWLEAMSRSGAQCLGLDWTVSLAKARSIVGDQIALQGNLDPSALFAPKERLDATVENMIQEAGSRGYVANLGHGIHKDTPPEHVQYFVDAVRRTSEKLNRNQS